MDQVVLGLVFVMVFVLSDVIMSIISPSYYEIMSVWVTGGSDKGEFIRTGFLVCAPVAVCWWLPGAVMSLLIVNVVLLPLIWWAFTRLDAKVRAHQTLRDITRAANEDVQRKLLARH